LRSSLIAQLLFLCAAALLVAPSRGEVPTAPSRDVADASAAAWGHELTQRQPDPDVRFGRLTNGLRYAIQRNETPKDGVAMRLRIGSGSMAERDDEQGLAHFLEHMAFRGSRNVPDGEVVRMLERQGLRFGPDTNAYTTHDQTVYQFNFPRANPSALEIGFKLFREIGGRLTLDQQLIDQEKGVVLSEERARDVPQQRALQADLNNALAGTRFVTRWPIGKTANIQTATSERLRRYYQSNYRPDNATLVVVGAIDVDEVERQVRGWFSDWESAGEADTLDLGKPKPASAAVEFVADGLTDTLSMSWVSAPDRRAPSLTVERERVLSQMAMGVLNLRLSDRSLQPGSPFVGAVAVLQPSLHRLAGITKLGVVAPAAQWRTAIDAMIEELRRLLEQGVLEADLQRLLPSLRGVFQANMARAATRQSAAIADALVKAADEGIVYTSAAQDLVLLESFLASVTADEVTAALRRAVSGKGPVLFRAAKAEPAGTEALTQQLAQALSRPLATVSAAPAPVLVVWPYTDLGTASAIVERSTDDELGTTTVRFANGTRMMVKPTAQEKNRIGVHVALGQGASGIPLNKAHANWALDALPLGGTGRLSVAEFSQWRQSSGKQVEVRLQVEPHSFALVGNTRPADLTAELQAMAAQARDVGFRPELGEKLAAIGPMVISQLEVNAGAVYRREFARVITGGDLRLEVIPTPASVAATVAADLPAVLSEALAGAADVVIVGDVAVDAAIAAVQSTFGAGPQRPRAARLSLRVFPAEDGEQRVVTHGGRADQAVLGRVWSLPDRRADLALAATSLVAAAIVQSRLVQTVREQLGITYSPNASASASLDVEGQSYFSAQIETPPENFDTFRMLLQAQLVALAARPVDADELQRSRQQLVEARRKSPERNSHWLFWLPRILQDRRLKTTMLGEAAAIDAVTAEQVQALIRDRIVDRRPVEVVSRARASLP
jgi:zinc protease